jgi:hypothetical protein
MSTTSGLPDLVYDPPANAYHADVEIDGIPFRFYVFPDGDSDDDPGHPWGASVFNIDVPYPPAPWTFTGEDPVQSGTGYRSKEEAYADQHRLMAEHVAAEIRYAKKINGG